MKNCILTAFLSLVTLGAATAQIGEAKPAAPAPATTAATYKVIAGYPLTTCIVSARQLDPKKTISTVSEGRTYNVCSDDCAKKIAAAPEEFAKQLDAAIIAAQTPFYALTTCPISGEKLDAAKTKTRVVDGMMVQYCCSKCATKGDGKKAEVTQKVRDAAYAAQSKAWSMEKCPVSNEKLKTGDTIDAMVGMRLVRLCCDDCVDEIQKNPAKVLAGLPAVAGGKPAAKDGGAGCCAEGEKKGDCCADEKGDKTEKKDAKAEKKDAK